MNMLFFNTDSHIDNFSHHVNVVFNDDYCIRNHDCMTQMTNVNFYL